MSFHFPRHRYPRTGCYLRLLATQASSCAPGTLMVMVCRDGRLCLSVTVVSNNPLTKVVCIRVRCKRIPYQTGLPDEGGAHKDLLSVYTPTSCTRVVCPGVALLSHYFIRFLLWWYYSLPLVGWNRTANAMCGAGLAWMYQNYRSVLGTYPAQSSLFWPCTLSCVGDETATTTDTPRNPSTCAPAATVPGALGAKPARSATGTGSFTTRCGTYAALSRCFYVVALHKYYNSKGISGVFAFTYTGGGGLFLLVFALCSLTLSVSNFDFFSRPPFCCSYYTLFLLCFLGKGGFLRQLQRRWRRQADLQYISGDSNVPHLPGPGTLLASFVDFVCRPFCFCRQIVLNAREEFRVGW